MGPQTEAADQLHQIKYRLEGESFRDAINRQARALCDDDAHYHKLREVLGDMRFSMAGRVQAGAGTGKAVTMANCFASGTLADSFVDGEGSIMQRAHEAATTLRMGGGIGYDFSTLRPRGDMIRRLRSHSTGPMAFARIFNEIGAATASTGERRGAQMLVMRIDHPDIIEFINAKHDNTSLTRFNISIMATDEFMEALAAKKTFSLRFGGQTYREIDAEELWEMVMRSTWDWAEPGILFVDRINDWNNLKYCETIATTNPCSEQPLPPFGACTLGSINLTKYLRRQPVSVHEIADRRGSFFSLDEEQLDEDLEVIVPAMDNIIERSAWPLEQQRIEALNKRRLGIGEMGLANALEAMGVPYGTPEFLEIQARVMARVTRACYRASALRAKEKGPFPLYDAEKYMQSKFIQSEALDDETRDLIRRHGVRNSHLTSVAPTGTISMCADNISSGIEPVFSYSMPRPIEMPAGRVMVEVQDYGAQFLGVRGRLADDISLDDHLGVLKVAQRFVDSSVSKTCNTNGKVPWEKFKSLYTEAYEAGCKGLSTFNNDGKRMALLTNKSEDADEGATCQIDPTTGRRECA